LVEVETGEGIADYIPPPEGWRDFGFHAPMSPVPLLAFSASNGNDGLPRWERHADRSECRCDPERTEAGGSASIEGHEAEVGTHPQGSAEDSGG